MFAPAHAEERLRLRVGTFRLRERHHVDTLRGLVRLMARVRGRRALHAVVLGLALAAAVTGGG